MSDGAAGQSSTPTPTPTPSSAQRAQRERRQHHRLRDLIDEMMATLRAAANRDVFSSEERADAARQLAAIMELSALCAPRSALR